MKNDRSPSRSSAGVCKFSLPTMQHLVSRSQAKVPTSTMAKPLRMVLDTLVQLNGQCCFGKAKKIGIEQCLAASPAIGIIKIVVSAKCTTVVKLWRPEICAK